MVDILVLLTQIRANIDELQRLNLVELEALWRHVLPKQSIPSLKCLLLQGLAWRLQEDGAPLDSTAHKLIASAMKTPTNRAGTFVPILKPAPLPEGTRLVRKWRGRHYEVLVEGSDFYFNNKRYTSLTAIAMEITGTHWSGPNFFGLVRKEKEVSCQR